tara:strand:- start:24458 stop:24829 length:372 start_codon:yes stop_codon:yes gene_type:complete
MKNIKNRKKVAKKVRATIKRSGESKIRLTIHKTLKNTYAQLIKEKDGADVTLAAISTLCDAFKKEAKNDFGSNVEAAKLVGKLIAGKAKDLGIDKVAFDRSGFRFHGRVKAIADSAKENGLII